MVIALYMFALAMIVGGAAVVAQGYGIVLNERGWTMVIAGTIAATSGFLLLGIATVAARLARVHLDLVELRQHSARLDAGTVPPPPARKADRTVESPAIGESAPPSDPGPPLSDRSPPRAAANDEAPEHAVLRAADVIPEPAEPDLAPTPAASAEPSEPPPPEPPATPPPTVVGTYNSGGNSYVMFSDGSIEADTPNGRFRFASLDELKEFIAAGGEEGGASRAS